MNAKNPGFLVFDRRFKQASGYLFSSLTAYCGPKTWFLKGLGLKRKDLI